MYPRPAKVRRNFATTVRRSFYTTVRRSFARRCGAALPRRCGAALPRRCGAALPRRCGAALPRRCGAALPDGAAQLPRRCSKHHDGAAQLTTVRRATVCPAARLGAGCSRPRLRRYAWSGSPEAIVDPRMRLLVPKGAPRTVALTLDACGGATDMRILQTLLDLSIPATIFLTELWLRGNAPVVAFVTGAVAISSACRTTASAICPRCWAAAGSMACRWPARWRRSAMRSRPAPTPSPRRVCNDRIGIVAPPPSTAKPRCPKSSRWAFASAPIRSMLTRVPRCLPPTLLLASDMQRTATSSSAISTSRTGPAVRASPKAFRRCTRPASGS